MIAIRPYLVFSSLILAACNMNGKQELSSQSIQQLSGTWVNQNQTEEIIFYKDKTAKLDFPKHQPPIRLISPYQAVKAHKIGIALGGFWSGPALIDTTSLDQQSIDVRFPDEEPETFHKLK